MSESEIQDLIYSFLQNSNNQVEKLSYITPNVKFYSWESDMLFLDRSNLPYEVEVKRTISDIKADFTNKAQKHLLISKGLGPSYMYFAIPEELISFVKLPSHYGILTFNKDKIKSYRAATCLHVKPLTERQRCELLRSLYFKYWKIRTNGNKNVSQHKERFRGIHNSRTHTI